MNILFFVFSFVEIVCCVDYLGAIQSSTTYIIDTPAYPDLAIYSLFLPTNTLGVSFSGQVLYETTFDEKTHL